MKPQKFDQLNFYSCLRLGFYSCQDSLNVEAKIQYFHSHCPSYLCFKACFSLAFTPVVILSHVLELLNYFDFNGYPVIS